MEVHLIRHTTPDIAEGICYGQSDLNLANTSDIEIQNTTELLGGKCEVVYSSPLTRCMKLANQISEDVIQDNRLMEVNFGQWEMKKWSDIPANELNIWMDEYVKTAPTQGESFFELSSRVVEFLSDLFDKNHEQVAIVTHAGVIRAAIAFVLGLPLENSFRLSIDYGSISSFSLHNGIFKLNTLNKK